MREKGLAIGTFPSSGDAANENNGGHHLLFLTLDFRNYERGLQPIKP